VRYLEGTSTGKLYSFERGLKKAFEELVAFIDAALEEGNDVFKLADLHEWYESRNNSLE